MKYDKIILDEFLPECTVKWCRAYPELEGGARFSQRFHEVCILELPIVQRCAYGAILRFL
jgi:hypothetical protein